jgi:hypothetical protein
MINNRHIHKENATLELGKASTDTHKPRQKSAILGERSSNRNYSDIHGGRVYEYVEESVV